MILAQKSKRRNKNLYHFTDHKLKPLLYVWLVRTRKPCTYLLFYSLVHSLQNTESDDVQLGVTIK